MKRQHDEKHLAFIRGLPCAICFNNIETEACHVRFTCALVGKLNAMGKKPDDAFTVPLCGQHHREQHTGNERRFWDGYCIDPLKLALALHHNTGDQDLCVSILVAHRHMASLRAPERGYEHHRQHQQTDS